jgi:hypothetical protein
MNLVSCQNCNKEFKFNCHLQRHLNGKKKCKRHSNIKYNCLNDNLNTLKNKYQKLSNQINLNDNTYKNNECAYCFKIYSTKGNLGNHIEKCCKNRQKLQEQLSLLENLIKNHKVDIIFKKKDKIINTNTNTNTNINTNINTNTNTIYPINNQLINIIIDKTKTIKELKNKCEDKNNKDQYNSITINNIIITKNDKNYINATQMCMAGDKLFDNWINLDNSKELIRLIESKLDNSAIENNNLEIWIHPYLAINLSQWISPMIELEVNEWIKNLFITNITLNEFELLNNEIKLKEEKIKLLENSFIKKQNRINYPSKNVIYILTTLENKKNRIYIIGKTKSLKHRLSSYNKTTEHEVIYYKGCASEEDMNVYELFVLNKLKEFREKANRDRFVLPIEKDISFFTDVIDKIINL